MATVRHFTTCTLFICISLLAIPLGAQNHGSPSSFVIDPNRPYVYLMCDHIGQGIPRDRSEPKTHIWLRVMNNSTVAIVVRENGTPDGSPKDVKAEAFSGETSRWLGKKAARAHGGNRVV